MVSATQFRCDSDHRRDAVIASSTMNGIDYLEVVDAWAKTSASSPRQRTLLVHLFKPPGAALDRGNVAITGGARIAVGVEWAYLRGAFPPGTLAPDEQAMIDALPDRDRVLVVRTTSSGDFSTYQLSLVRSAVDPRPPMAFDPVLSSVALFFKVECPSELDCAVPDARPPAVAVEPEIDYLAKDWTSFRRLMLERLSAIAPDWRERHAADVGMVAVELIAYAADHLSYFQDAVATEAYLGTARKRASVRRHARLLDYPIDDGANARAWIAVAWTGPAVATLPRGTSFVTRVPDLPVVARAPGALAVAAAAGAACFESLEPLVLDAGLNQIQIYTWGDERCWLPRGATRTTLDNTGNRLAGLRPGAVLVLGELVSPTTALPEDANPAHRQAVRLATVDLAATDPLFTEPDGVTPQRIAEVTWHDDDALQFPLLAPASVAWGNIVLADHGLSRAGEPLPVIARAAGYQPRLAAGPVTQAAPYDAALPASHALRQQPRDVLPQISLAFPDEPGVRWQPRRDLLASDPSERAFVVETEDDGSAVLRFGDGILGRLPDPTPLGADQRPDPAKRVLASYRAGNGSAGNIAAGAIAHAVLDPVSGTAFDQIARVTNLLAAAGGRDPETLDDVKRYAPQAFRTQQRAVTTDDYAQIAERHPEVAKAAATRRWTGSWYTIFLSIDRRGGGPIDRAFEAELLAFLEPFRLAGQDLEIEQPVFVPLEIVLAICVEPRYHRADVRRALLAALSSRDLPDGSRGFFHPDNVTFGQPIYLSRVVAAAMAVPGVRWVDPSAGRTVFRRLHDRPSNTDLARGQIDIARLEIARLDNDPSFPEHGTIDFALDGGS